MMEELDIRYSEFEDGKHLLNWLSDETICKWYPPTGEKEVKIFADNWIGFAKYKSSLTALFNGQICAIGTLFLMPYKKVAHQCMLYLIVDPAFSGRKIGDSLLKNMLNLAKNYFHLEVVVVEVFEGSLLINLLEKYNFELFAVQKDFVKVDSKFINKRLYQYFL